MHQKKDGKTMTTNTYHMSTCTHLGGTGLGIHHEAEGAGLAFLGPYLGDQRPQAVRVANEVFAVDVRHHVALLDAAPTGLAEAGGDDDPARRRGQVRLVLGPAAGHQDVVHALLR